MSYKQAKKQHNLFNRLHVFRLHSHEWCLIALEGFIEANGGSASRVSLVTYVHYITYELVLLARLAATRSRSLLLIFVMTSIYFEMHNESQLHYIVY